MCVVAIETICFVSFSCVAIRVELAARGFGVQRVFLIKSNQGNWEGWIKVRKAAEKVRCTQSVYFLAYLTLKYILFK